MNLRPYQIECIDVITKAFKEGTTRQAISLPTGTGKTLTFAALAKQMNERTLIIAHRDELITQAIDKTKMMWPEVDIGKVKAEVNEYDSQVVVASIQSAQTNKRLEELKNQDFKLLVIDECHHSTAESYQKLIEAINPSLLVGFTATINRGDNATLTDVFQSITYEKSLLEMIQAGYLCDLRGYRYLTEQKLDDVSITGGDFVTSSLSMAINTPTRNRIVVTAYFKHSKDKPAIAFCANVQHATDLAKMFREYGVKAEAIYGSMKSDERKRILKEFSQGKIDVLTNCEVLTEGFDEPKIHTVLMARPTKSNALYTQCIGRGTRLHPSKKFCIVIDFVDNRVDVCQLATLAGKPVKRGKLLSKVIEEAQKEEEAKKQAEDLDLIVKEVEFDVLARSGFRWFGVDDNYILYLGNELKVLLRKVKGNKYIAEVFERYKLKEKLCEPLNLEYAQGMAEDYIRSKSEYRKLVDPKAAWRSKLASSPQRNLLTKSNIKFQANITAGEAQELLSQAFAKKDMWKLEPATDKQKRALKGKKIKHSSKLTKGEAAQLLYQW